MNNEIEFEACRQSKEYFFENYYLVPDIINGGLTKFRLRPYQKEVLAGIDEHSNIIGLKARQIGWTTLAVANALHDVLFNEWRPWKFISRNEKAAQDMVGKAVIAYRRLPGWMKAMMPKEDGVTQGGMSFANGSRIEAEPATGSSFRGDAVHGLLMDECAFMEYAEEIWGAAEAGVYGTRMLFSTANGMGNFFHDIWLDAQRPNSAWHDYFYPWGVVPERDDDWYEGKKLSYRGREWLFFQEYPSTPEEAFAKSGRVAFGSDLLADSFEERVPEAQYRWDIGDDVAVEVEVGSDVDIPIMIWHEPEIMRDEFDRPVWKPNYVVSADVAEGLEHGDFTYVNVFDVNTGHQVASSKSAIPVPYLDGLINWLGNYYFRGLVIVEHNMAGVLPLDRLWRDRWYPRLYRMDKFAEYKLADRTPRYGWQTTPRTKPKMVNDFIYALAEGQVVLHDPEFLVESQTFVADGKGGFSATAANHDDVVMGTLIGWQGVMDSYQYEILWEDELVPTVTHELLDNEFFDLDGGVTNGDRLERPIGRRVPEEERVKSVILTRANFQKPK